MLITKIYFVLKSEQNWEILLDIQILLISVRHFEYLRSYDFLQNLYNSDSYQRYSEILIKIQYA